MATIEQTRWFVARMGAMWLACAPLLFARPAPQSDEVLEIPARRERLDELRPSPRTVLRIEVDQLLPDGEWQRPSSGRARVEFFARGFVYIHEPFLRDGVAETTLPAICEALAPTSVFWRFSVRDDSNELLGRDSVWQTIAATRRREVRVVPAPPTRIEVVAAESGAPLDRERDRWSCKVMEPRRDCDQCGERSSSARLVTIGDSWFEVVGLPADAIAGELTLAISAPGRVARSVTVDARAGGRREVRLWPRTTIEILVDRRPLEGHFATCITVEAVDGAICWSQMIELLSTANMVADVPGCALMLFDEFGVELGRLPQAASSSSGDVVLPRQVELAAGRLRWGGGLSRGGSPSRRGCRHSDVERPVSTVRIELRDGATCVPCASWLRFIDEEPEVAGIRADGAAAIAQMGAPGPYTLVFDPIDGFAPIAPIYVDVPGVPSGQVVALAPIVIALRREQR